MSGRVIAADVGGTKTLMQLLERRDGKWQALEERRYESTLYPTFESLFREFHAAAGPAAAGCFAVAGPVSDGTARVTNLAWVIDAKRIAAEFGLERVIVVNDFYAIAASVPRLGEDDFEIIHEAPRDPSSPIAILGAGTGLGEALVVPRPPDEWVVVPSEGGHSDFAPNNEAQDGLLRFLRARYGHVSWERALSGPGLVNILTFLRDSRPDLAAHDFSVDAAEDDLPALIATEDGRGNPLARATFDLFVDVYGAEAGNLGLECLARGGVFLAGGIAAKNVGRFRDGRFVRAFTDKGRLSSLVRQFPVFVITNPKVGLLGAAWLAGGVANDE
ncbi:MAG TPA: glucokinase [Thermoanaerobaculia bacterium]|nr:glucokinase [Thermoanaerobaculia bacterium]